MTPGRYAVRRTDGLAEQALGNFDAATDVQASQMARGWAGRDAALAWDAWALVIAETGAVVATYSATDDRVVLGS